MPSLYPTCLDRCIAEIVRACFDTIARVVGIIYRDPNDRNDNVKTTFETWRHLTNVPLTLGASLSATLMQNIDMQLTTNENVEEHAEIDKNEEEEVSIMQFNASLYLLTKEIATVRLRAM